MGQVSTYVEDDALEAAKRAADRTNMSLSQWFANFAIAEKRKQSEGWDGFFTALDRLHEDGDADFLALDGLRASELANSPREIW